MFNFIKNKLSGNPTDPSRRLGYHTYYNNAITQVFLKFRVILLLAATSAGISLAVPLLLNYDIFEALKLIYDTFRILGVGALVSEIGRSMLWNTLMFLFHCILQSLFWSVLLFIVVFPLSFKYLDWQSRKAYEKKYIRGIAKMPMKRLIKELRNED